MRHSVLWGRRRQGKSTLALALAIVSGKRPIFIFDPCAQFTYFPVARDLEAAMSTQGIFRIPVETSDPETEFAELMDFLDGGTWEWSDYALIVDETSQLQRPQAAHPAILRLIRTGPDDVFVAETLHRPSETHGTVKALSTDYFIFQTSLRRDLEVISDNYGPDVASAVSKLGAYQCVHIWIDPGGAIRWKIWDDPAIWYVPLREGNEQ